MPAGHRLPPDAQAASGTDAAGTRSSSSQRSGVLHGGRNRARSHTHGTVFGTGRAGSSGTGGSPMWLCVGSSGARRAGRWWCGPVPMCRLTHRLCSRAGVGRWPLGPQPGCGAAEPGIRHQHDDCSGARQVAGVVGAWSAADLAELPCCAHAAADLQDLPPGPVHAVGQAVDGGGSGGPGVAGAGQGPCPVPG